MRVEPAETRTWIWAWRQGRVRTEDRNGHGVPVLGARHVGRQTGQWRGLLLMAVQVNMGQVLGSLCHVARMVGAGRAKQPKVSRVVEEEQSRASVSTPRQEHDSSNSDKATRLTAFHTSVCYTLFHCRRLLLDIWDLQDLLDAPGRDHSIQSNPRTWSEYKLM